MASIVDQLAKELGVSNASVSRALNDKPGVGSELREKILNRARELNYTSSVMARGLATSQTFNIGFFIREKTGLPTLNDPFYAEVLRGVEQAVSHSDYHVSVGTLTDDIIARPLDFRFVRERRIDAMILAGPDISSDFIMAMLTSDIPLVIVDNQLRQTHVNSINCDDEGGAYLAAQHLIQQGHTQIGILSGPKHWASNARRVMGYRRALEEAGLAVNVTYMDQTTIDSGERGYDELVKHYAGITAICAVNDSVAIGAIRAAKRAGVNIPNDLSVVGFDDIAWATLNDPPLTTIHIPKEQMGKEAALRLLMSLNDPELLPTEMIIPVRLIERASSATPELM